MCSDQVATRLGVPEWALRASLPSSGLQRASRMRLSKPWSSSSRGSRLRASLYRVCIRLSKDTKGPNCHFAKAEPGSSSQGSKGDRKFHQDAVVYVSQVHDRKCALLALMLLCILLTKPVFARSCAACLQSAAARLFEVARPAYMNS